MWGFSPFPPPRGVAPWRWWLHFVASSLFILVLLPFAFLMAYILVSEEQQTYAKSKRSQNWQATQGYIVESFIDERGTKSFAPLVVYSYQVGDVQYRSNRILFSLKRPKFDTREEALRLLEPFGEFKDDTSLKLKDRIEVIKAQAGRNRHTEVFFDPANPQNSTLRKEYMISADTSVFVCGIPIFLFVCVICVTSVLSWHRSIKNGEYKAAVENGGT